MRTLTSRSAWIVTARTKIGRVTVALGLSLLPVALTGCQSAPKQQTYTATQVAEAVESAATEARTQAETSAIQRLADQRRAAQAELATRRREADERLAAEQQLARRRLEAYRQAADERLASFQAEADRKLASKVETASKEGFAGGEKAVTDRIAAETAAREMARAETAAKSLREFNEALSTTSLLGDRKLVDKKAVEMLARQILELVAAHMERLGYQVVLHVPRKEAVSMEYFGRAKVYLAVSSAFRDRFTDHFEAMTVLDALNLLNKLYGFSVWVGHQERIVWLGYPSASPRPLANTMVDIYFDERKFTGATEEPKPEPEVKPVKYPEPEPRAFED